MKLSEQDFDITIAWLECNEGDVNEKKACEVVAKFLDRAKWNHIAQQLAKEHNISLRQAKYALKKGNENGKT